MSFCCLSRQVVFGDKFSYIHGTFCQEYLVFQGRWSLMAVVSQDRFYCTLIYTIPESSLCLPSGQDNTVRVWHLPNRTHHFLQQTCLFNPGEDRSLEDLEGQVLTHVTFNSTGKLLAGALDNLVNIWAVAGDIWSG